MNVSSGQPSAFTIFVSTLWFYHEFMSITKAFSNRFCTVNYILPFFIPATNIYTLQNVSSPTPQWFQALEKVYYVYLNVILLAFLFKSEVQATNNCVLRDSEPNSSSKIWDSCHRCIFTVPQNYLLLSNYIRDSVYLKTVWSYCFMSTSFNMTRIIFPPKHLWLKYYRENW